MDDERTSEQVQADDNLATAIERASRAHGHLENGWAVGDFVICVEYTGFSDETVGRERYAYILPRDFLPTHRIVGMLDYTKTLVTQSAD